MKLVKQLQILKSQISSKFKNIMPNEEIIEKIAEILKIKFKPLTGISSAYIYGSALTNKFSSASDIDVLFIVDNVDDPNTLLHKIKTTRDSVENYKLDINVVFMDEFVRRWHIYRPPTYFYWIKARNKFLWGVDHIQSIKESEITAESLYRRAVDLAQSSRSVYLNNKDDAFWEAKYKRWLITLICEINYLDDELDFDLVSCINKLSSKYLELTGIANLLQNQVTMKIISEAAESLVLFIRQRFFKNI